MAEPTGPVWWLGQAPRHVARKEREAFDGERISLGPLGSPGRQKARREPTSRSSQLCVQRGLSTTCWLSGALHAGPLDTPEFNVHHTSSVAGGSLDHAREQGGGSPTRPALLMRRRNASAGCSLSRVGGVMRIRCSGAGCACTVLCAGLCGRRGPIERGAGRALPTPCCDDLEERIAELEATTVRSGSSKLSFRLYGQVNRALLLWKDGFDSSDHVVDNHTSSSRFGFFGQATIKPGVTAGYRLEIETPFPSSDEIFNAPMAAPAFSPGRTSCGSARIIGPSPARIWRPLGWLSVAGNRRRDDH